MRVFRNYLEADDRKKRDSERFSVSLPVSLRPEGLRVVVVAMGDISATGFMAHTHEPIGLGAYVNIDLPGVGSTHARVRWMVGARVGARFLEPIDVDYCRAAMIKLAQAA